VAPDRGGEPGPRRTIDAPERGDASGRGGGARGDRPIPRPTLPGFGDPSTSLRQPPGRGAAPGRERPPVTRDRGTPVPDFSGMSRGAQGRSRQEGAGQVAPLRLGGPQPSPRGTPRVEAPRPQPRVERPTPRTSAPSVRPPSDEPRSRGRSDDAKREKDRD
jgi:hypothetical protein